MIECGNTCLGLLQGCGDLKAINLFSLLWDSVLTTSLAAPPPYTRLRSGLASARGEEKKNSTIIILGCIEIIKWLTKNRCHISQAKKGRKVIDTKFPSVSPPHHFLDYSFILMQIRPKIPPTKEPRDLSTGFIKHLSTYLTGATKREKDSPKRLQLSLQDLFFSFLSPLSSFLPLRDNYSIYPTCLYHYCYLSHSNDMPITVPHIRRRSSVATSSEQSSGVHTLLELLLLLMLSSLPHVIPVLLILPLSA